MTAIRKLQEEYDAQLPDYHGAMAMDLIRHIAGLYSGKAIKGDFTQIYITGNEIWMAQQVLASQIDGAQREVETREKQEPLSFQFVNAVKQLCKDFSDRQDRPYMGDVYSALDALLVNEGIPVAPDQQAELAQEENASLRGALEQTYMALIGYLPAHRNEITDAAIKTASAALGYTADPFPSPKRQSKPCGECHLQDGERCDICGALQRTQP